MLNPLICFVCHLLQWLIRWDKNRNCSTWGCGYRRWPASAERFFSLLLERWWPLSTRQRRPSRRWLADWDSSYGTLSPVRHDTIVICFESLTPFLIWFVFSAAFARCSGDVDRSILRPPQRQRPHPGGSRQPLEFAGPGNHRLLVLVMMIDAMWEWKRGHWQFSLFLVRFVTGSTLSHLVNIILLALVNADERRKYVKPMPSEKTNGAVLLYWKGDRCNLPVAFKAITFSLHVFFCTKKEKDWPKWIRSIKSTQMSSYYLLLLFCALFFVTAFATLNFFFFILIIYFGH